MRPQSFEEIAKAFNWYRAVVEDNKDPLKATRVRVRIHGLHTPANENSGEAFEYVSTSELPWAEVMGPTTFGLIGGVGVSSVLRQGTWVWVALERGDPNKPVVIGTISGVNSQTPAGQYASGKGFFDPAEKHPFLARCEETDVNRLARGEDLSKQYYDYVDPNLGLDTTVHQKTNDTLDQQTGISDGKSGADVSQSEPASLSGNTQYPESQVLETPSGHVVELDDTPGNERVKLWHRTGSYLEIRPDGSFVQKSTSTGSASHYIHMSSVEEHVAKSVKRYVEENLDEIIKGYVHRHIQGELKEHVTGDITMDSDGNVTWKIGSNLTIEVGGTAKIQAGPEIDMDAGVINLN